MKSTQKKSFLSWTILLIILIIANTAYSQVTLTPSIHHAPYNISCFGGSDGSISLAVSGGVAPYKYTWSNGATTQNISNVPAGYYSVVVQDAGTLTWNAEITLLEPRDLEVIPLAYKYPNEYNISLNGACNGMISVTVNNGVPPYSYLWRDGNTGQSRTSLCRGSYSLILTDANGCSVSTETIDLLEPERSDWTMTGNSGTTPGIQFIGTNDNKDLMFKTNSIERLKISANGDIKFPSLTSAYNQVLMTDPTGKIIPIPLPTPVCTGPVTFPWQQSLYNVNDVFSCWRRFGIGTDNPQQRLEVRGMARFTAGISLSNYVEIGHDDANAMLYNIGIGDLLINYNKPKNVRLCTGTSGDVETGGTTYLASGSGNVRIGTNQLNTTYKLDVLGSINASNLFINGLSLSDGLWDNNTTDIFRPTGKVGIGTATPHEALQIGDRFVFHDGGNKVLGFNYSFDATDKKLVNGYSSAIYFTNNGDLIFKTSPNGNASDQINWTNALSISNDGHVAIGTTPSSNYKMVVEGKLGAREIKVTNVSNWPDFVFDKSYILQPLSELKQYLDTANHLPGLECREEIEKNGLNVESTFNALTKNIEEMYLYILQINQRLVELEKSNVNTNH